VASARQKAAGAHGRGESTAERSAQAGWGLSAASIHWGKRGAAPKPVAVTERDRRLLALLHDVNYLSSSQLALLGWGEDSSCARRRLRLLHDRGLIDKFRPAAPAGSFEWNYRLTTEGWRLILEPDTGPEGRPYAPADIHSIAYVEHDLQVNALVLDIAHRAPAGKGPLLDAMPFTWHGPRFGEIDPREERAPEGSSRLRVASDQRFFPADSRQGILKPDATMILGGTEPSQAVLLEFDRTARPHKQLQRLRRYDWFLTEGWMRGRYASHPTPPVMVFITLRENALAALIKAAHQALGAGRGGPDAGRRERHYCGRERFLSGDWRMLRVPALPANPMANGDPLPRPPHHRCLWQGQVQSGWRERAGSGEQTIRSSWMRTVQRSKATGAAVVAGGDGNGDLMAGTEAGGRQRGGGRRSQSRGAGRSRRGSATGTFGRFGARGRQTLHLCCWQPRWRGTQVAGRSPAVKQFPVPACGGALLVLANLLDRSSTTC
jgi:hypothetical protein